MVVLANIQCCFKVRETVAELYKILRTVYGNETLSHMHCMSSDGLEYAEWNVRTLKMIQEVSSYQLAQNLEIVTVFEQVGRDLQVTLKLRENKVHNN